MNKKQDMMVAYDVKKRNAKKGPKMTDSEVIKAKPEYAEGGIIDSMKTGISNFITKEKREMEKVKQIENGTYVDPKAGHMPNKRKYAMGGEVSQPKSIAEAIMMKRKQHDDSDEQVDIANNNREEPNSFYHLNEHEALEYNMNDAFEDIDQPMDSNRHDVDIDSDEHDMISQIRSKMNMKRQFRDK